VLRVICQVNKPDRTAAPHAGVADLAAEVIIVHDGTGGFVGARAVPAQRAGDACPWAKAAIGDLCIECPHQGRQGKAEGRFGRLHLFLASLWVSKASPLGVIWAHIPAGRAVQLAAVPAVPLAFLTNTGK